MSDSSRLRIAYVTAYDARRRWAMSGTPYYVGQALQKHCGEVSFLGPAPQMIPVPGKDYSWPHSVMLSKFYARYFDDRLNRGEFDVVFTAFQATPTAFLKTRLPIVYVADTTYSQFVRYYPPHWNEGWVSVRDGNIVEKKAIENARLLLYASRWAADSAVKDYRADPSRVHVLPLGANLDDIPSRDAALGRRCGKTCVLLFLGSEWERKGGELAFETLLELERMGVPAELIVCGDVPPSRFSHKAMKVIPRLHKQRQSDRKTLDGLFRRATFLFLPTRAECAGIVFCEASVYGLPSIATDTGGVSGLVTEGENGHLLSLSASAKDYALLIERIFRSPAEYAALARRSRDAFEKRLNWDAWAMAAGRLMKSVLRTSEAK